MTRNDTRQNDMSRSTKRGGVVINLWGTDRDVFQTQEKKNSRPVVIMLELPRASSFDARWWISSIMFQSVSHTYVGHVTLQARFIGSSAPVPAWMGN